MVVFTVPPAHTTSTAAFTAAESASSRYSNDDDEDDYERFRKMRRLMLDQPPDLLDRVSSFERPGDYRPSVEPLRMDSIEHYQSIRNSSDTSFNSTKPSLTHAIERRQSKYYSPPTEPSFDNERELNFNEERDGRGDRDRDPGRFNRDTDLLYSRRQEKPRYDEDDVPLPKELTMKFGRLTCSLCNVTLITQNMANLHYSGKNHEKRVMVFLNEWCEKTNHPLLDCWLKKLQNKRLKQQPVSVKNLYCEICKLTLTSMIVATQHYDGRAHNIRKRELEINSYNKNKETGRMQGEKEKNEASGMGAQEGLDAKIDRNAVNGCGRKSNSQFGKRRFQMDSTGDSSKKGSLVSFLRTCTGRSTCPLYCLDRPQSMLSEPSMTTPPQLTAPALPIGSQHFITPYPSTAIPDLPLRLRVAETILLPPTATPCCRDCSPASHRDSVLPGQILTSHRDFMLPGLCPITLQP
uniref:U1-type domain-containing protein n=1 Tax=Timema cristinae TaxID=61476 RepID=A0A7R9GVD5_TIMCR|nr:unnamed protein product [Timema cristinae]